MFRKNNHNGESIIEWLVLAGVVVIIIGSAAVGIAQATSAQGGNLSDWVKSFSVGS